MTTAIDDHGPRLDAGAIEHALIGGDLAKLTPAQRLTYYHQVCASLGLNPLTKPFAYITLNGKLTLYALKDCTEQLRSLRNISVQIVAREVTEDIYVVTARASMTNGRQDESIGAVPIGNIKGEARANAIMKSETKAKRRVTLSICGLGMLDETEVESIPTAGGYSVSAPAMTATSVLPPGLPEGQPETVSDPKTGGPSGILTITKVLLVEEGEHPQYEITLSSGREILTRNESAVTLATELCQAVPPVPIEIVYGPRGGFKGFARVDKPDVLTTELPPMIADEIPF